MASDKATRLVSMVIQRRPHCSATKAVVPLPHVGSSTRSPGSVVINMQRSMILCDVWTTYNLSDANPAIVVSVQRLVKGVTGKSANSLTYLRVRPIKSTRSESVSLFSPGASVLNVPLPGVQSAPLNRNSLTSSPCAGRWLVMLSSAKIRDPSGRFPRLISESELILRISPSGNRRFV